MEEVVGAGQATKTPQRREKWTKEEDELLRIAVQTFGPGKWQQVSLHVPGRSALQCLHRWTKALPLSSTWSVQEDHQLRIWVQTHGPTQWSQCSVHIPGRSGKQCRERWVNALNSSVKVGEWTEEEDQVILREFERVGAKWSEVAQALPGRTESSIKSRFYSNLRKLRPQRLVSSSDSSAVDSERIETGMQIFNLLKYMQKLEGMLSCTREEIGLLENAIDQEVKAPSS